jgi:hypothetical protein
MASGMNKIAHIKPRPLVAVAPVNAAEQFPNLLQYQSTEDGSSSGAEGATIHMKVNDVLIAVCCVIAVLAILGGIWWVLMEVVMPYFL